MASKATALRFALFLAVITIAAHGSDNDNVATQNSIAAQEFDNDNAQTCVYSVYVRTGDIFKAGTDSNISLVLANEEGSKFKISNLVSWGGLMGLNYDYFEMGRLDIFSGRGPCLKGRVCSMDLLSDGTGLFAGWYCNYVDVTSTGPTSSCKKQKFTVNTWLQPPSQLSYSANSCNSNYADAAIATVVM